MCRESGIDLENKLEKLLLHHEVPMPFSLWFANAAKGHYLEAENKPSRLEGLALSY